MPVKGDSRKMTGRAGEDQAARYLMSRGHTILARNWRSGHLELDIVSLAEDGIHFVEVKSRTVPSQAEPEENVGPAKQRHMVAAAGRYLQQCRMDGMDCRFDVISVLFDKDSFTIRYLPEAFLPVYV